MRCPGCRRLRAAGGDLSCGRREHRKDARRGKAVQCDRGKCRRLSSAGRTGLHKKLGIWRDGAGPQSLWDYCSDRWEPAAAAAPRRCCPIKGNIGGPPRASRPGRLRRSPRPQARASVIRLAGRRRSARTEPPEQPPRRQRPGPSEPIRRRARHRLRQPYNADSDRIGRCSERSCLHSSSGPPSTWCM